MEDEYAINVPGQFVISECDTCHTQHAPVRNCPEMTEDDYDREEDYWKWSDRL
jgi:hypothetical protein